MHVTVRMPRVSMPSLMKGQHYIPPFKEFVVVCVMALVIFFIVKRLFKK